MSNQLDHHHLTSFGFLLSMKTFADSLRKVSVEEDPMNEL